MWSFAQCLRMKGDSLSITQKCHVNKNFNWFEGVDLWLPSTNNRLEGSNRVIESQYTNRDRLPMARFISTLKEMIGDISQKYVPGANKKTIYDSVLLTLSEWTAGYHLARSEYDMSDAVILSEAFLLHLYALKLKEQMQHRNFKNWATPVSCQSELINTEQVCAKKSF